jgi:hypothetical protein
MGHVAQEMQQGDDVLEDMTFTRWVLLFVLGWTVGTVFWIVGNSIGVAVSMGLSYQVAVLLLAFIIKKH